MNKNLSKILTSCLLLSALLTPLITQSSSSLNNLIDLLNDGTKLSTNYGNQLDKQVIDQRSKIAQLQREINNALFGIAPLKKTELGIRQKALAKMTGIKRELDQLKKELPGIVKNLKAIKKKAEKTGQIHQARPVIY